MARIRVPRALDEELPASPALQKLTAVPTVGFPLLQLSPCVDFDDGRGVALIGNSEGEICLVEFKGGGVGQRLALDDDIPNIHSNDINGNTSPILVCPCAVLATY